jgi:hypothetical protein
MDDAFGDAERRRRVDIPLRSGPRGDRCAVVMLTVAVRRFQDGSSTLQEARARLVVSSPIGDSGCRAAAAQVWARCERHVRRTRSSAGRLLGQCRHRSGRQSVNDPEFFVALAAASPTNTLAEGEKKVRTSAGWTSALFYIIVALLLDACPRSACDSELGNEARFCASAVLRQPRLTLRPPRPRASRSTTSSRSSGLVVVIRARWSSRAPWLGDTASSVCSARRHGRGVPRRRSRWPGRRAEIPSTIDR